VIVRITRNGQVFGPYSEADVRRYLATGNILPSDLAQAEGDEDWVPVFELFPEAVATAAATAPSYPGGLPTLYPDPPDFPWWGVLLLAIVTGGLFAVIWDVVESAWLRRIDRSSIAVWFYLANAIVFCCRLPAIAHTVWYNVSGYPVSVEVSHSHLGLLSFALFFLTRYIFRSELLRHFNGPEPIGLRLGPILTFFFGGLYFQYHFNRINEVKRILRVSVPLA
jgi:hypothetical protein